MEASLSGKRLFLKRKTMGASKLQAVTRVLSSDMLSGFVGAAGSLFNGGDRLNSKIKTAMKRAYSFKSFEYLRTVIYPVAGKINVPLPPQC